MIKHSPQALKNMPKVTQKLRTENHLTQAIDFVDYFSRVSIEWE